jgi:hypothetical protein
MRRKNTHLYVRKQVELYREDVDALGKLAKKSKFGKFKPFIESILSKYAKKYKP